MRERRIFAAVIALLVLGLIVRHPTADSRLITHDRSDPAPHQMQAALDTGLIGVRVLYTWTVRSLDAR